jgi:hypothetical protein
MAEANFWLLARSRALSALWDAGLEKREGYLRLAHCALRRHPGRQRQGVVPDLQIGTALCEHELKGMRSDRSRSNY